MLCLAGQKQGMNVYNFIQASNLSSVHIHPSVIQEVPASPSYSFSSLEIELGEETRYFEEKIDEKRPTWKTLDNKKGICKMTYIIILKSSISHDHIQNWRYRAWIVAIVMINGLVREQLVSWTEILSSRTQTCSRTALMIMFAVACSLHLYYY